MLGFHNGSFYNEFRRANYDFAIIHNYLTLPQVSPEAKVTSDYDSPIDLPDLIPEGNFANIPPHLPFFHKILLDLPPSTPSNLLQRQFKQYRRAQDNYNLHNCNDNIFCSTVVPSMRIVPEISLNLPFTDEILPN